jgi:hypothetical protein
MSEAPSLPTFEAFDAVVRLGYGLDEALDGISRPIFVAINYEGAQEVTLEQIGTLTACSSELRSALRMAIQQLDKIDEATRDDLVTINRAGQHENMPTFNEWGTRNDFETLYAKARADA